MAGAVSGKGAAGAIGAVSARGEAEDEHSGGWVSERRNGAGPVGLIEVGAALDAANFCTVGAKALAAVAGCNSGEEVFELGGHSWRINEDEGRGLIEPVGLMHELIRGEFALDVLNKYWAGV